MTSTLPSGDRLPPRRLPWLYLMSGQLALALAFIATAISPGAFAQFFYHPRALAIVHLVTIGWITGSILGALYIIAPVAFRAPVRAGRLDAAAFVLWLVGLTGMVAHFWIDSYAGMLWSAGTVLASILMVGWRILPAILSARVPTTHKLHLPVAFANILAAGMLGGWLGLERIGATAVPGSPLPTIYAHAHLAAVGWATLTVVGASQRLLPMFLPSAMPPATLAVANLVLVQVGLVWLVVALMGDPVATSGWGTAPGGWLIAAGLVAFLAQVVWMLGHRRPAPSALRRPDPALGHTLLSLISLTVATAIGIRILHLPPSAEELRLMVAYGALGLVGFLSQLIIGIGSRLLPLTAWMQSFVDSGHVAPPHSQHRLIDRRIQRLVLMSWAIGVPTLAVAVRWSHEPAIAGAALALAVAVVLDGVNRVLVIRRTPAIEGGRETSI